MEKWIHMERKDIKDKDGSVKRHGRPP